MVTKHNDLIAILTTLCRTVIRRFSVSTALFFLGLYVTIGAISQALAKFVEFVVEMLHIHKSNTPRNIFTIRFLKSGPQNRIDIPTLPQKRIAFHTHSTRRKCFNNFTIPHLYSRLLLPSSSIVILVLSSLKLPLGSSYPPLLLLLWRLRDLYLS